jgi:integrase
MQRLRSQPGIPARALELGILTAARRNEVLGARWDEIQGDLWTVPAERMKRKREHRIPLSRHALKLLAALPREGAYVFAGARVSKPIPLMSIRDVLVKMGSKTTMHGFRSTFRDWAAEQTNYPNQPSHRREIHAVATQSPLPEQAQLGAAEQHVAISQPLHSGSYFSPPNERIIASFSLQKSRSSYPYKL